MILGLNHSSAVIVTHYISKMKLFGQMDTIFLTVWTVLSSYLLPIQCHFIWKIFLPLKLQKSNIFSNRLMFTTMQWPLSPACLIKMNAWTIQSVIFSYLSSVRSCTTYKGHYSTHSHMYHHLLRLICTIHRLQLDTDSQTQMNHCINLFCFNLLKSFINVTICSLTSIIQSRKFSISINKNQYSSSYPHKCV